MRLIRSAFMSCHHLVQRDRLPMDPISNNLSDCSHAMVMWCPPTGNGRTDNVEFTATSAANADTPTAWPTSTALCDATDACSATDSLFKCRARQHVDQQQHDQHQQHEHQQQQREQWQRHAFHIWQSYVRRKSHLKALHVLAAAHHQSVIYHKVFAAWKSLTKLGLLTMMRQQSNKQSMHRELSNIMARQQLVTEYRFKTTASKAFATWRRQSHLSVAAAQGFWCHNMLKKGCRGWWQCVLAGEQSRQADRYANPYATHHGTPCYTHHSSLPDDAAALPGFADTFKDQQLRAVSIQSKPGSGHTRLTSENGGNTPERSNDVYSTAADQVGQSDMPQIATARVQLGSAVAMKVGGRSPLRQQPSTCYVQHHGVDDAHVAHRETSAVKQPLNCQPTPPLTPRQSCHEGRSSLDGRLDAVLRKLTDMGSKLKQGNVHSHSSQSTPVKGESNWHVVQAIPTSPGFSHPNSTPTSHQVAHHHASISAPMIQQDETHWAPSPAFTRVTSVQRLPHLHHCHPQQQQQQHQLLLQQPQQPQQQVGCPRRTFTWGNVAHCQKLVAEALSCPSISSTFPAYQAITSSAAALHDYLAILNEDITAG